MGLRPLLMTASRLSFHIFSSISLLLYVLISL
jgi:hypothetical protein